MHRGGKPSRDGADFAGDWAGPFKALRPRRVATFPKRNHEADGPKGAAIRASRCPSKDTEKRTSAAALRRTELVLALRMRVRHRMHCSRIQLGPRYHSFLRLL